MLKVKNLTKLYGGNQSVVDISFTINDGETVGLLGPNGAGKSTTMRMMTGYLTPTSGEITIDGTNVTENPLEARKYIGYLPEIPPLYMDMTVNEHLEFVCSLRQVKKEAVQAEIEKVCGYLHITDVTGRLIKNLSKGYRQRVGFAASLIGEPKLLILDEPTVGLDPVQIVEIRSLIQKLSGKMTIIISSHILSEIASACSRIIILNKGRIAADGSQQQIEAQYSDKTRIRVEIKGDAARAAEILRSCVRDQAVVEQDGVENRFLVTAPRGVDLREDIFLAFAASGDAAALLTLQLLNMTLEDIFMDIIKEG